MITIPSINGAAASNQTRSKKKVSKAAEGFSELFAGALDTDAADAISAPHAISGISPLLSAQEVSDESVAVKKAVRHAHETLDQLEKIRMALLTGSVPSSMLAQIEALAVAEHSPLNDPALNDLLDEIELRAAVERTKLELCAAAQDENP